ncbi:hypothetical protein KCTCHS21_10930 [Cohnella abietis]|uniref:Uncharacterized protein n=1 Tax=Cohnella abietis TaxID=2507935 RepID=A0A3T1D0T0_9BACL|nr:hypothetical protein KCTCHS21_10930 [Cohnella abietis]
MHDNFEQRGHEEVRMEVDVRYFRATGSWRGMKGVRSKIISSNWVMWRYERREMYDNFEQRGRGEV